LTIVSRTECGIRLTLKNGLEIIRGEVCERKRTTVAIREIA